MGHRASQHRFVLEQVFDCRLPNTARIFEMEVSMSDAVAPTPASVPAGLAEPAFDSNSMRVLKERYFAKKADGTQETPKEFVWRVASAIAQPERPYAGALGRDPDAVVDGVARQFYDMMSRRDFLPNTPCLVNAGRPLSMLSACFVLPVPDSIEGIFYNLKAMALIQKSGGGCVSADSRVWTTYCGLEPIEVLFNRATIDGRAGVQQGNGVAYDVRDLGIRTVSMDASSGKTALRDVTHVWKFDVPAESQIVVRTREGTEVQTSAWHPFMVLRGREFVEVRADELAAGDVILGPDRPDDFWPWTGYRTVSGLTIDEEIGWLIGFTLGDGSFDYVPSLRQERLRWFSGTTDVLDRVRAILARHGIVAKIDKDPRGGNHFVTTLAQEFVASMLAACGFSKRGPKDRRTRIPEHIAKSPLPVVRAFLAGLIDGGGTVADDGSPSYTTASSEMAHDVAALMSLLGYRPTLHREEPYGRGKVPTYTVLLCPLPQVDDLARDVADSLVSELRKSRLHSDSRVQTALSLPFAPWRDTLRAFGLVQDRGTAGSGAVADALNRWSRNAAGRVGRDDLRSIAAALEQVDESASDLLDSVARRGQEIESVELAPKALPYYDLTVEGWNTYASGRTGMALIHNTGFSFSDLRHQGAEVTSTGKDASGPVSFMKVFNAATDSIKQGGVRRGANMGVLRVDHPDIFHFMRCKKELDAENKALWNRLSDTGRYTEAELAHLYQELLQTQINNFNISVGVTDAFMQAVRDDTDFDLLDPRTKEIVKSVRAREIWEAIIEGAWQNGEPGVLFLDHPQANPLPGLGPIAATNPCGEQFLHGYDSCNLGSINVGHFYDARAKDVDWERLAQTVALSIRFLDNVIDANIYPIDEIKEMVTNNRRVGLGVMGFADLLIQLEVAYGSPEAIEFSAKLMKFIQQRAEETSETLARERGDFPNKHLSVWAGDSRPRRNAALLSVAPTGTISMIAGCSFGCEPYFGMAYTKHVMKDAEGRPQHLYYVVPLFEEIAKDEGFFSDELLGKIEENRGSLKGIGGVPEHWQRVFTTSADVTVDQHIDMLAAFQKYTCNAVSKCVAEGTLIPTDKGLIPIEQMGEAAPAAFGRLSGDYHVVSHDGRHHKVTGFYNNGRGQTVRIRTKNGATLEASPTHHVLTINGWKAMLDLQVGDLIVGRFEEASGAGAAPIDTSAYPFRNTATPVTLPSAMSPELALWLGMVAADGHTVESTGNVGISEKDESGDVARTFDALSVRLFNQTPRVVVDKRTGVRSRHLTSRALSRYVADLVGKGARNKHVPAQILRGSTAEKLAFLNGVSLDGFVANDANRKHLVVYSGVSSRLADQLEAICRSIGVPACYRWTETKSNGYLVHQVRVTAELQELIEPVETRKKVSSENPKRLVRVPSEVLTMSLPNAHSEFSNLRSLKERQPQHCAASTLEKLHVPLADPKEYLVRIASIEMSEAQMYDIEVDEAHSYVVNGLVSHNTINAPNDDTRENVSRAIFRAYEAGCKGFTYYRDGSRTEQVVTFSKDGDIKGGNRDVAAKEAASETQAPAAQTGTKGLEELDIDALLAKANALLEVR
jgi:adenosylcobalamin-dependent ribonucleoside-diphosphate reductase